MRPYSLRARLLRRVVGWINQENYYEDQVDFIIFGKTLDSAIDSLISGEAEDENLRGQMPKCRNS